MSKKTINLIIEKDDDLPVLKRLKKFAPVTAAVCLIYSISLIYLKLNTSEYNKLKAEVTSSEKKITSYQATEGLYLATFNILDVINKILAKNCSTVADTLPEVYGIDSDEIDIKTLTVDRNGQMSFSLTAYSLTALEVFVGELLNKQIDAVFSDIKAQGILRDKDGSYTMTISLKYRKSPAATS